MLKLAGRVKGIQFLTQRCNSPKPDSPERFRKSQFPCRDATEKAHFGAGQKCGHAQHFIEETQWKTFGNNSIRRGNQERLHAYVCESKRREHLSGFIGGIRFSAKTFDVVGHDPAEALPRASFEESGLNPYFVTKEGVEII